MNMYQFVRGNPVNLTDPFGLYEEDVHRYLSEYLARHAGFSNKEAKEIGLATQSLDIPGDPRNAMKGLGANKEGMKNFHFPSKKQVEKLRKNSLASNKIDYKSVGEYIHAFEDTYGHSTGKGDRNWDYYGGKDGGNIGHAKEGHLPDHTWRDKEKAMKMAENTYKEMISIASKYGKKTSNEWDIIKEKVNEFVSHEAETYKQYYGGVYGVENTSSKGLTEKIQILDKDFELDQYMVDAHESMKQNLKDKAVDRIKEAEIKDGALTITF
jgi:hypothetical protein